MSTATKKPLGVPRGGMKSRLHELTALGQSVWIDYLSRDLIASGSLARAIREDAVVGVTSNPTIFEKALSRGNAYDSQLASSHSGTPRASSSNSRCTT